MSSALTVQVVSDFVCPWCFVGKRRLDKAIAARPDMDIEVSWLPFQLSPDMPREGKNRKAHYQDIFGEERAVLIMESMRDTGKEEGIDFGSDDAAMSPNTLSAHCLLYWASQDSGVNTDALAEALFSAHHEHCNDIGNIDVLADLAASAGMDRAEVRRKLESGEDEELLQQMMQRIRSNQVSGVPFFVLNGQFALSGAQPEDVLVKALDEVAGSATEAAD